MKTIKDFKFLLQVFLFSMLLYGFAACSHAVFGQTPDSVSLSSSIAAAQDTAALTLGKVYNDVKEGVNALAESLKVGAEYIFVVLVKQQVVEAVVLLISYLIAISAILILLRYAKRFDAEWGIKEERGQCDSAVTCYIVALILGIISVIYIGATVQFVVTGLVNPEYGALQEVMEFVKDARRYY